MDLAIDQPRYLTHRADNPERCLRGIAAVAGGPQYRAVVQSE